MNALRERCGRVGAAVFGWTPRWCECAGQRALQGAAPLRGDAISGVFGKRGRKMRDHAMRELRFETAARKRRRNRACFETLCNDVAETQSVSNGMCAEAQRRFVRSASARLCHGGENGNPCCDSFHPLSNS